MTFRERALFELRRCIEKIETGEHQSLFIATLSEDGHSFVILHDDQVPNSREKMVDYLTNLLEAAS